MGASLSCPVEVAAPGVSSSPCDGPTRPRAPPQGETDLCGFEGELCLPLLLARCLQRLELDLERGEVVVCFLDSSCICVWVRLELPHEGGLSLDLLGNLVLGRHSDRARKRSRSGKD